MNLGQFTEPKLLVPRLLSEFRDSTISVLSQRLESAERIEDSTAFTHAVLDHESQVSAVFDKVAFPMARGRIVRELSFALGLSQQGVRWGTGRTPLVQMVFLFAVPLSEGQRYISLVLTLSSLLKEETVFSALRRCTQPEEMWTVLNHVRCVRTGPGATEVPP
jgi:mannitol/fructose-specific phosphotransferase system IIA component (Ntr-type)